MGIGKPGPQPVFGQASEKLLNTLLSNGLSKSFLYHFL